MTEDVKERPQQQTTEAQEAKQETGKAVAPAESRPAYLHPLEEIERLFDALTSRGWLSPWSRDWSMLSRIPSPFEGKTPKVDLIDRDDELVLHAELPGVKKEDVEVTLSEDSLTIRATTRKEQKEEKGNYLRQEISYGEIVRTIPLPAAVDVDKAKSKFEDGILEIHMPKVEKSKRRTIPVE